jgi:hypothetical protein
MSGIIDSAISSRFFQLVNESSLTVTDLSFELGSAHMVTTPYFDLPRGPRGGGPTRMKEAEVRDLPPFLGRFLNQGGSA